MADVTPPVGLASFAAAAISKGDPLKTGFQAFFYSIRTALLPFLFIFNTDLLLIDVGPVQAVFVFIVALIAMRNAPSRYLLLTQDRSILFEFTGCLHLADGFETVDEVRPAKTASFVAAGPMIAERERLWGAEMADLIHELTGNKHATVGLERLNAGSKFALKDAGLKIVDAQQPVEMARAIKSPEEMKCVIASLRATEIGVGKLREAIRPGLTEAELWSVLHKSVIEQNGDYVETRLLNAGERTNPWFQETSASVIGANDLIALDTDVVGCHGYYADFSRTFHDMEDDVIRGATVTYDHEITFPPPPPKVQAIAAKSKEKPKELTPEEKRAQEIEAFKAQTKQQVTLLTVGGLLMLLVGLVAPASFLQHFIVFVLAIFVGFQVIWNVSHSLHTPLMAITNAISSIIIVGALLQIGSGSYLIILLAGLSIFMRKT